MLEILQKLSSSQESRKLKIFDSILNLVSFSTPKWKLSAAQIVWNFLSLLSIHLVTLLRAQKWSKYSVRGLLNSYTSLLLLELVSGSTTGWARLFLSTLQTINFQKMKQFGVTKKWVEKTSREVEAKLGKTFSLSKEIFGVRKGSILVFFRQFLIEYFILLFLIYWQFMSMVIPSARACLCLRSLVPNISLDFTESDVSLKF